MTNVSISHINVTHRRWNHIERIRRAQGIRAALKEKLLDAYMDADYALHYDNDASGHEHFTLVAVELERRFDRVEAWLDGATSIFAAEI